ncbi:TPA: hypothetical protein I0F87_RS09545 [Enterococcus faecalis]|nr:hypothetical protein [Enterococcus faecalis]
MNIFFKAQIFVIILLVVVTFLYWLFDSKKQKKFTVIDKYLVRKDTPIFYRSYRQETIYTSIGYRSISHKRPVNLYLSIDGQFLEIMSTPLFGKELTSVDKEILVIKIEDTEGRKKLITYSIGQLSDNAIKDLSQISIGDIINVNQITTDLDDSELSQTAILINNNSFL